MNRFVHLGAIRSRECQDSYLNLLRHWPVEEVEDRLGGCHGVSCDVVVADTEEPARVIQYSLFS